MRRIEGAGPGPAAHVALRPVHAPRLFPVLVVLYAALAGAFLAWRVTVTAWDVWFAPLLLAADGFGVAMMTMFLVITCRIDAPVPRPADRPYVVDVLIPTVNEPIEVLRATITGALRMRGRARVIVLDDGDRAEVAALCRELGAECHARRERAGAKGGNMNFGLGLTDAELVATLDADHIPHPELITRLVGYFDDPAVGFVQTPQTYYNHDSFLFRRRRDGRLWSEQGMFYDVIQPAKNRWNSAFYVGTSAILRRAALDDVGGFATTTATEDIHTSIRIHARGWRSLFVPEVLALGLETASLREFYRQRRRWAAGSLGLLLRSPDSPLRARGLTPGQRLNYANATLGHAYGPQLAVYLVVPALCVATRMNPVTIDPFLLLAVYVPYIALCFVLLWVFSRRTHHLWFDETYGLANIPAQVAGGYQGLVHARRKHGATRKRAARGERTAVHGVLAAVIALCALTVAGAAALLALEPADDVGMLVVAGVVAGVFGAMLATFMRTLRRYERADHADAVTPDEVLALLSAGRPVAVAPPVARRPAPVPILEAGVELPPGA